MSDTDQRQEQDPQSPVPARVLRELAADLRSLIDTTRLWVTRTVNAELVMLYWEIGSRIRCDILGDTRAEYGNQIVSTLSRQLTAEAFKTGPSNPVACGSDGFVDATSKSGRSLGFRPKEPPWLE
jgi:hypothetical protein